MKRRAFLIAGVTSVSVSAGLAGCTGATERMIRRIQGSAGKSAGTTPRSARSSRPTTTAESETSGTPHRNATDATGNPKTREIRIDVSNPSHDERGTLDRESVTLSDRTGGSIDISGYTLDYSGSNQQYTFPKGTVLTPGLLTVRSGSRPESAGPAKRNPAGPTYYANFTQPVLDDSGGTVTLGDISGHVVAKTRYPPRTAASSRK